MTSIQRGGNGELWGVAASAVLSLSRPHQPRVICRQIAAHVADSSPDRFEISSSPMDEQTREGCWPYVVKIHVCARVNVFPVWC